jgi:hypothetical protein
MQGMTLLSNTLGRAARTRLAAAVAAGALATACSQTPASPTMTTVTPTGTATVATAAVSSAQGTSQSWQDFEARGWNCRTPVPSVTVCSPPGQPLPVVAIPPAQPPADRAETVMLKRWRNDVFEANVLLIRPEIYNGQSCESTGQPYFYIGVLGYFECAHLVGN